ncbi:putative protein N(5)-glutamine methyltransferase [Cellulomonas fimi]|uniref:Methyltransferase small domain-containing protein n=1 Tax=Cellulomonas fimi TaxID=1708 RepID=A0A7Y0QFK9_CELFI|nr:putative protein N(5)-glutamine methyltransferase [Cellulomonas fimi]NMR19156.1 putative protein N(5)-glutamine methyltransferase [Cellulomonas fimi]
MPEAPDDVAGPVVATLRAAGCVYAEDEAALLVAAAATPAELDLLVERRASGVPLELVLGWAELSGLRVAVEPGVFVPRRRTELLVAEAVLLGEQRARPGASAATARGLVLVDLCCGSGAIGLAVATGLAANGVAGVELHAVDIQPAAVACARRNLVAVGGRAHLGDLDAPLPPEIRGLVDLLVANAPYVPTAEIPLLPAEARLYEPRVTLDGGADGLDVQRRVIAAAPRLLATGGHVLVESSGLQAPRTVQAMTRAGLLARVVRSADLDATVVVGTRPV